MFAKLLESRTSILPGSIYPNAIRQPAFSRASVRQKSSPRDSGTKAQIAEAHLLTPLRCLATCCKDLEDSEQLHALKSGQAEKVQRGKGGSCLGKRTLTRRARQLVACRCMPLAEQASISSTCGMDMEPDGQRTDEENAPHAAWKGSVTGKLAVIRTHCIAIEPVRLMEMLAAHSDTKQSGQALPSCRLRQCA